MTTHGVLWPVTFWVEVGTPNLRDVAERIDNRVGRSALRARTRETRRDPGERDVVRAKETAEHQEEGKVSSSGLGRRGRDDETDHADSERDGQVQAALGFPVRHARDDDREDGRDEVGRRREEERDRLRKSEGCDHGGEELRNRACSGLGDDNEGEEVELPREGGVSK